METSAFFTSLNMRIKVVILLSILFAFELSAQTTLRGRVTDLNSGEALIGATIIYGKGKGTATDLDGNYSLPILEGERNIKVSYVGYNTIVK